MSSDLVLQRTSFALRDILWAEIQPLAPMRDIFQSAQAIAFTNPKDTHRDNSLKLSLWLYQVTENEFLKNQPPARPRNGNPLQDVKTPLALNLYYLVTPFTLTAEQDLQVLGFIMRVFYDTPTIYINEPSNRVFEELRLILCRLNLEELTRVWEALQEPYRLSICYKVTVARIESSEVSQSARVIEASNDYGEVPKTFTG
jgi:hypothetical protein